MLRSRSKRRSSRMPVRRQNRWRKSGAMPTRRSPRTTFAPAWRCSARSSRRRRTTAPRGCASRARSCKSARPTTTRKSSCSSALPRRPISPISAPPAAPKRRTVLRFSATCWPSARCGGRRSTRCGCRLNCAKSRTCAGNTKDCASSTASACSTTASTPTPPRRAPVSSSPKTCCRAPTSRPSSFLPARPSRLCRRPRSSFASRDCSTAKPTRSRCAPGCRPRCTRRCRSPRSFRSMCATGSRPRVSPPRPMCCRAPASAAFRSSAPTRAASRSRFIGLAIAALRMPSAATIRRGAATFSAA